MAQFSCQVHTDGAVHVVQVGGDVDMAVTTQLWAVLEPLLTPGARVAMECSQITFFDSMALRIAMQAAIRAKECDADFVLVAPSDPMARVLDLSGAIEMFTVHASTAEAAVAQSGEPSVGD